MTPRLGAWPNRRRTGLALLLGAMSVLAFAPFHFYFVPLVTLSLLMWLWLRAQTRLQAALLGFAFGLGMFGAGISWIYISLHDYGGMPAPLAVGLLAVLSSILALFPTVAGYLQSVVCVSHRANCMLLVPAVWTLTEWVRGWLFTGFPWLAMGYSQVPASPLGGFAPLLGVFGVTLVTLLSAGTLCLAVTERDWRWIGFLLLMWGCGYAVKSIHWTQPSGPPIEVSLLQGNIPQDIKFSEANLTNTLTTYLDLASRSPSRLIVMPESAIPLVYDDVPAGYLQEFVNIGRRNQGDVLVGLFSQNDKGEYFNSVFSFGSSPTQIYRKRHLVMLGEYIPFRPLLGWIVNDVLHIPMSDLSPGAAGQPVFEVSGQRIDVDICYEDVFGEEVIRNLPLATLLVNVSNDAWFGRSIGPQQHMQMSQMRALETGRQMLRATNTGVTAFIDQRGEVVSRAREFTTTALNGMAQGFEGATPYVTCGNYTVVVLASLGCIIAWRLHRAGCAASAPPPRRTKLSLLPMNLTQLRKTQ